MVENNDLHLEQLITRINTALCYNPERNTLAMSCVELEINDLMVNHKKALKLEGMLKITRGNPAIHFPIMPIIDFAEIQSKENSLILNQPVMHFHLTKRKRRSI
jgi:hypothetical protein